MCQVKHQLFSGVAPAWVHARSARGKGNKAAGPNQIIRGREPEQTPRVHDQHFFIQGLGRLGLCVHWIPRKTQKSARWLWCWCCGFSLSVLAFCPYSGVGAKGHIVRMPHHFVAQHTSPSHSLHPWVNTLSRYREDFMSTAKSERFRSYPSHINAP